MNRAITQNLLALSCIGLPTTATLADAKQEELAWLGDGNRSLFEIRYNSLIDDTERTFEAYSFGFSHTLISPFRALDESRLLVDITSSSANSSEIESNDSRFILGIEGGTQLAPILLVALSDFQDRYREKSLKAGLSYQLDELELKLSTYVIDIDGQFSSQSSLLNNCIEESEIYSKLRYGLSFESNYNAGLWQFYTSASALNANDFDQELDSIAECLRLSVSDRLERESGSVGRFLEERRLNSPATRIRDTQNRSLSSGSSEFEATIELAREFRFCDFRIGLTVVDSELTSNPIQYSYADLDGDLGDRFSVGLGLAHENQLHSEQLELRLGFHF